MYGLDDLKFELAVTDSQVPCPVMDCRNLVRRQRNVFRCKPEFFCDVHRIYISPSTFEYDTEEQNVLWDIDLLREHMSSKRESRIARDNSEDAVTWNVFRFLERQNLLVPYLSTLTGLPHRQAMAIFWSHDLETGKPWTYLWEAREVFEGDPCRGSEPDLVIQTDRTLLLIEAKLTADNQTTPSRFGDPKRYLSGANGWWRHAFVPGAEYHQIAEVEGKYELMRFWLLGSWMANRLGLELMLVNLTRDADERDIEPRFRRWLPAEKRERFQRTSWESIYQFLHSAALACAEKDAMVRYFRTKSTGYRPVGRVRQIQRAFLT